MHTHNDSLLLLSMWILSSLYLLTLISDAPGDKSERLSSMEDRDMLTNAKEEFINTFLF